MKMKFLLLLIFIIISKPHALFSMAAQEFQKWEAQRQRWLKEQYAWFQEWQNAQWSTLPWTLQELEQSYI